MKIQGLPPDLGGVKNITERKAQKTVSTVRSEAPDTVELTVGMGKKELVEMSGSIPVEFPVREDVIKTVSKRIAANTYETPEVRESVAERLLESPRFQERRAGLPHPRHPNGRRRWKPREPALRKAFTISGHSGSSRRKTRESTGVVGKTVTK